MTQALSDSDFVDEAVGSRVELRAGVGVLVLFWALVLAELVPLWSFVYTPTTDGPSHVYNAVVLRDYARADRPAFREFFVRNIRPVPNWVAPAALTGLTWVLPPLLAEKVLFSIYLVLMPVSVRYALGALGRGATWLAVAALPMTANFYYHEGLTNYCLSLTMFFFVVGYWLRHGRHFTARQTVWFCLMLGVLYFSHLIGLIMAGVFIANVIAWRGDWHPARSGFKGAARTLIAAAPWILLVVWFFFDEHSDRMVKPAMAHALHWSHRLRNILSWMKSYRNEELITAGVMVGGIVCLTIWLLRVRLQSMAGDGRGGRTGRLGRIRAGRFDVLLAIAGVFLLIFCIAPGAAAGGSMIVIRLACFPLFALLLWSAGQLCTGILSAPSVRRIQFVVIGASCCVALFLLASQMRSYARLNPYLAEFDEVNGQIPAGSTLLPIYFSDGGDLDSQGRRLSSGSSPLVEAADYTAGQRGIVDLDNYEAGVDYFPLRYGAGLDPYDLIVDAGENFVGYHDRTGKNVDYVLIWTGGVDRDDSLTRSVLRQIAAHYELVYTTKYSGYGKLYRRKSS